MTHRIRADINTLTTSRAYRASRIEVVKVLLEDNIYGDTRPVGEIHNNGDPLRTDVKR